MKVKRLEFRVIRNEKGIALIISLLLLLVATVVGVIALSTSTTNVMIVGNQRLNEINFAAADAGILVSLPVIENIVYNRALPVAGDPYFALVIDTGDLDVNLIPDFIEELTGGTFPNPDADTPTTASATSGAPDLWFASDANTTVSIDVDYLYAAVMAGGAMEFASGYEGVGKGLGQAGAEIYYRINAEAAGPVGSTTTAGAVYRYVVK